MTDYIKGPHTTIFTGQTECRKTHLVLDLIEEEYKKHFDYIIIICPTIGMIRAMPGTGSKMMTRFGL